MRDYFIRRFLLLIPTLLVITMIVFGVTRIAPGGPLEQAMMEAQTVSMEGGGGSNEGAALSEEQLKQMEELYGYDKPIYEAYLIWLGVLPRELNKREVVFEEDSVTATARVRVPTFHIAVMDWDGDGYVQRSEVPDSIKSYVRFNKIDINLDGVIDGYEAELPEATIERPRERVQLKRDEKGNVYITNIEDTLVPWKVRMNHPFNELLAPLESAYEAYLGLSPETSEVLAPVDQKLRAFVKKVQGSSNLDWGDANRNLKNPEFASLIDELKESLLVVSKPYLDVEGKVEKIKNLSVDVVEAKDLSSRRSVINTLQVTIDKINRSEFETKDLKASYLHGDSDKGEAKSLVEISKRDHQYCRLVGKIEVSGLGELESRIQAIKHALGLCLDSLGKIHKASKEKPKAEVYRVRYAGVLQGDLGKSFRHGEPVLSMMFDRLPISTFYGLLTFFFTFLICVPLGIAKAMKHNTWFDNGSSIFIFMGYSIPGYVLGALTVVFLAARLELFPTGGFVGPNYESTPIANVSVQSGSSEWTAPSHGLKDGQEVWLEGDMPAAAPVLEKEVGYVVAVKGNNTFELFPESGATPVLLHGAAAKVVLYRHTDSIERIKDLAWHAVLPLLCYLVGSFAFVTMLMKNHLMDNLSADYMRTAIAKGVPFSQAVRRHALRNSLIPLATNLGHQITLFVAGSFLIETIFDINGFGLLGFKSVLDRDIPVVMGIFLLSATLMLLGNIISDILVALVDPRVRFN